jgi:hypothetical protein
MDKKNINLSVPVLVTPIVDSKFTEVFENEHVTKCKLKVFYVGETGDGRVFTKDFSEKLLTSLPYTPVVGYYDEEEEDFKAHVEKQYMFGHVPIDASITFEEIDGNTYAVTDVILFTQRHDVGKIASKIVGSQHSLELNPDTVEYKITRNQKGEMTSLVFTDGDFYGLSIVGDAEKPAFSGSEFFTEMPDAQKNSFTQSLMSFIGTIKNYYSNEGGVGMDKFLETLVTNLGEGVSNYIKQTYEEQQEEVYKALFAKLGEYSCFILQMDEATVVYYDFEKGYMRSNYTTSEEGVILDEPVSVQARFLTPDEIESTFAQKTDVGEVTTEVTLTREEEEVLAAEFALGLPVREEEGVADGGTESTEGEFQATINEEIGHEENNTNDDETSFTESEEEKEAREESEREDAVREQEKLELEGFRRMAKLEFIGSYEKFLNKEDFATMKETVDTFDNESLELALKIKAADFLIAASKDNDDNEAPIAQHVFKNVDNTTKLSRIETLTLKYKNKN